MPAQIRSALPSDLAPVQDVVAQAYAHYVPRIGRKPGPMLDDYEALIAAQRVFVLVAEQAVEGLLVLIPDGDAMLLDNVALRPQAQGRGYGRQLIAYAEQAARDAGFTHIRLYTHEKMTENIELYGRLGFIETHRLEEKGFRRVYMAKDIRPASIPSDSA